MDHRILLIEDSKDIAISIVQTLRRDCACKVAESIKEARAYLEEGGFDLVLLDLTLPDGEGFKVCSYIRQSDTLRDLPIIFLTGRADIEDKEMAFAMGADDYIVKPVEARELRARVMSRLRRTARGAQENLCAGNLKLNSSTLQVIVGNGPAEVSLSFTSLEFKILHFLCRSEGKVFSRGQLISAAWGEGVHLLERTVDSHISHLRKKLAEASSSHTIEPVRGFGYKFSSTKKAA